MTTGYRQPAERPAPKHIFLVRYQPGLGNEFIHVVYSEGRQHADAAFDRCVSGEGPTAEQAVRVWVGEIIADWQGTREPSPIPAAVDAAPFLTLSCIDSCDYTGHRRYRLAEYEDGQAALDAVPLDELRLLPGDEYYVIRVLRHAHLRD